MIYQTNIRWRIRRSKRFRATLSVDGETGQCPNFLRWLFSFFHPLFVLSVWHLSLIFVPYPSALTIFAFGTDRFIRNSSKSSFRSAFGQALAPTSPGPFRSFILFQSNDRVFSRLDGRDACDTLPLFLINDRASVTHHCWGDPVSHLTLISSQSADRTALGFGSSANNYYKYYI